MRSALIVSLFCLLLFAAGCAPMLSTGQSLQLQGSGNLVTQEFTFDTANRLLAASNFKVTLVPGEKVVVTVTADDNVMEYVTVRVSNGELRLELKPGRGYSMENATLKAKVAMPIPSVAMLQDNALLDLGKGLRAGELTIKLSGNGIVAGETLSAARVSLASNGNGQARLSGATAELTLDGRGNAIAACPELQVHTANVTLRDNAMAALKVTDKLDYNVSGNAGFVYTGNPELGQQQRTGNAAVAQK